MRKALALLALLAIPATATGQTPDSASVSPILGLNPGREIRATAATLQHREQGKVTAIDADSIWFKRTTWRGGVDTVVAWRDLRSLELNNPNREASFLIGFGLGYLAGVLVTRKDDAEQNVGLNVGLGLFQGTISALWNPLPNWQLIPLSRPAAADTSRS